MRYKGSNTGSLIDTLWNVQTNKVKNTISLQIYYLVTFLSYHLQIWTVYSLLNFEKTECWEFFNLRKKLPLKKGDNFLEFWSLKIYCSILKKFPH